ncbi:MAG: DegT/DnrJ/EryC1/StrS family aminotransferase [Bacilli bacterium]
MMKGLDELLLLIHFCNRMCLARGRAAVFADIDADTYNIDPKSFEAKISPAQKPSCRPSLWAVRKNG